jgi:hypothetical protein
MDMVGNASEWCLASEAPVAKGGAWVTEVWINLRPASRILSSFPTSRAFYKGFRCAKDSA